MQRWLSTCLSLSVWQTTRLLTYLKSVSSLTLSSWWVIPTSTYSILLLVVYTLCWYVVELGSVLHLYLVCEGNKFRFLSGLESSGECGPYYFYGKSCPWLQYLQTKSHMCLNMQTAQNTDKNFVDFSSLSNCYAVVCHISCSKTGQIFTLLDTRKYINIAKCFFFATELICHSCWVQQLW